MRMCTRYYRLDGGEEKIRSQGGRGRGGPSAASGAFPFTAGRALVRPNRSRTGRGGGVATATLHPPPKARSRRRSALAAQLELAEPGRAH